MNKPILLLDNYDSFTYNIAHMLKELGACVDVIRNDRIPLEAVSEYDKILLSPGPGIPSEAGILLPLIQKYASTKCILGICLGEQAIGEVFGAKLINLSTVYHGVEDQIEILAEDPIFKGLDRTFTAGRYHSWVVSKDHFPETLEITAMDKSSGNIMALRHRTYNVRGLQFHPESVLTPQGKIMIENWINL